MKNILNNNKKVIQVLMFALQKKFRRGNVIKSVFDYRFNSNKHTHMFLFVTQAFWLFIERYVFLMCNLRLFEITEWEPLKRGAIWFKSLKNNKCRSCQFP